MYTVLIVDDEEPVLSSYGFLLESGIDGFSLAGKARSGYEAIKMMYELKPDVVFMDINMPGIDGLDTIAEVHDKFPDVVFVLSTAYERFDLARRAIPLGVHAYLVKPVTKKTFTETLAGIRTTLTRRRSSNVSSPENDVIKQFMSEDIWREIEGERWQFLCEHLDLGSEQGLVAFISMDSDQEPTFSAINVHLEFKYRFFFIKHLNFGMYFFPGEIRRDALEKTLGEILSSVVSQSILSFFACGSLRKGCDLYLSCGEALEEINRKRDKTDIKLRERMRIIQIRRKIGLSSFEEVRALFSAYWEEVFGTYDFTLAKAKMISLFTILIDDCTSCYQVHSEESPPFLPADEIAPLANLAEWNSWALSSFNRLYQCARQTRTGKFPVPLVKAIVFIDENFVRQIQLHDAAEAASVSTAYLSRLFGEHMNSSFIDYLTVLRIERAEKLIRENRSSIKEVSFAVGYQDPNYFSKIFRKIVGISPSMYAQRGLYEE